MIQLAPSLAPIYDGTTYGLKDGGRVPGLSRGWVSSQHWRAPVKGATPLSYSQAAWDKALDSDAHQGPLLIDLESIFNGVPITANGQMPIPHWAEPHIRRILERARKRRPDMRITTYGGQWFWPSIAPSEWWTNNPHVLQRLVMMSVLARQGLCDWVGFEAYVVPRLRPDGRTIDEVESDRCLVQLLDKAGDTLRHYVGDVTLVPILSPILAGAKARELKLVQPPEMFREHCIYARSRYPAVWCWGGVELDAAGEYIGVRPLPLDLDYFTDPNASKPESKPEAKPETKPTLKAQPITKETR